MWAVKLIVAEEPAVFRNGRKPARWAGIVQSIYKQPNLPVEEAYPAAVLSVVGGGLGVCFPEADERAAG